MKNKKSIYIYLLITIILIQTALMMFYFFNCRVGFHADETASYGLANSYKQNQPFMLDNGEKLYDKWVDGTNLKNYLTVDKNHRFSFDSVYHNSSLDANPPLHLYFLHFVCSFFPDVFSWTFAFVINIIAFVVSQVYIFLLSKKITDNNIIAIGTIVLYGFCTGAMDITMFLRLYALGVMFIVIFAYYSHLIYQDRRDNKNLLKNLILVYVFLFLGAHTMYIFYVVAFAIVLLYCLYYLFTKRIKLFLAYGFICLSSTSLSLAAFPYLFKSTADSNGTYSYNFVQYPFKMQLRLYISKLTRDLFGAHISPLPNPYLEYFLIFIVCLVILIVPFVIVFRKEKFIHKIKDYIVNKFKTFKRDFKSFKYSLFVYLITILFLWIIVSYKTSYYLMNKYANRYMFPVYPLAAILVVCSVYYLVKFFWNKKLINYFIIACCLLFAIWSRLSFGSNDYFFIEEQEGMSLAEIEEDSNCVLVLDSVMFISVFSPILYDIDSYYLTDFASYKKFDSYDNIDKTKPTYLIFNDMYVLPDDSDVKESEEFKTIYGSIEDYFVYEKEIFNTFETQDVSEIEYKGMEAIMGRRYKIYKISFNDN